MDSHEQTQNPASPLVSAKEAIGLIVAMVTLLSLGAAAVIRFDRVEREQARAGSEISTHGQEIRRHDSALAEMRGDVKSTLEMVERIWNRLERANP